MNAPPVVPEEVRTPRVPLNAKLARRLLVDFIGDEVRKTGVTRVVLGLSGGVDSALAAGLAAEALGPANVLGVKMPYKTSSAESLRHADLVAERFGIETMTVEISAQIDAYFALFPDASASRRGNKMARERMTILYDHSASLGALVLGTSNKTELLLGYGTHYGDMASALNPLGDLYKVQVWDLARHAGVPHDVVDKPPTADLWVGQTDEEELGFAYPEVDRLLYAMIDLRYARDELVAAGFAPAFVDGVARMVQRSQFKRRLPVIAKLSRRTIDRDFRYARDWGL
jgi:NAD+ synthase